jgi:acyl-CoA dehydrogenase
MDFQLNEQQLAIDEGVRKVCAQFDDQYWTDCETNLHFPQEYYQAMAEGGWLGITMPEDVGGAGLGVTEAAVMMHACTASNGGYSAASAIHINMFGPHAIVVHGTPEQKQRWLRPLVEAPTPATRSRAARCGPPPARSPTRSFCSPAQPQKKTAKNQPTA